MASRFLLFAVLFLLAVAVSSNSEGDALGALKARLTDPGNVLESWDTSLVDPCTWFHVYCDSSNNVIRLVLGSSNLSGTLAPELGNLQHLQYLELYTNKIGGKLPVELGNMKELQSMDLYENNLEGEIPKSFGQLKNLMFLRLNNNKLTGTVPKEVIDLPNLKVLDVSNNNISNPPRSTLWEFSH